MVTVSITIAITVVTTTATTTTNNNDDVNNNVTNNTTNDFSNATTNTQHINNILLDEPPEPSLGGRRLGYVLRKSDDILDCQQVLLW